MVDPSSIAAPIISSVVTGILSAWLTANLAFNRTRKEKLWERRFKSYQDILHHLNDIGTGFDNMMSALGVNKDVSEEDKKEFRERYFKGRKNLERHLYTSDLLLDRSIRPRIEQLLNEIQDAQMGADWFTYLDNSTGAVWQCVRSITATAKRDLAR